MTIAFFGVATSPADNSGLTGPTVTLTPPASMQDGDLVFVSVRYRASTGTITNSVTGGQAWTAETQYDTTNIRARAFWCRFNGTWAANPEFTITTGTNAIDAQMLVFRPTSAAYTWSLDAAPATATYTAPSTPFTVTRAGRDTVAPSTVTIAGWHSVDNNTWGTLSGTGWSKTSLGAQYRNTNNSSTWAYNIRTSQGTVVDVSQNQATLGGDAGSTLLITFAETLVSTAPTGVEATSVAGSLGVSLAHTGIVGVEATSAAGELTIAEAGGANATATPTGAAIAAAVGTLVLIVSSVIGPTGVGVGASTASLGPNITVVPAGVAATASAGTASAIGVAGGIVPIGGVVSNTAAGSLASAITVQGIAGVQAAAAAGAVSVSGAGISHGAGQPSAVFATAEAGGVSVLTLLHLQGVASLITAEDLGSSLTISELDAVQGAVTAGTTTPAVSIPISAVSATASAGTVATVATVVQVPTGVSAVATTGNLAGVTAGAGAAAIEGVQAAAQAGTATVHWTAQFTIEAAEATAVANDVAVDAGDSEPVEVFPAGVAATIQLGALSTGEARAALDGLSVAAQPGSPSVVAVSTRPGKRPRHRATVGRANRTLVVSKSRRKTVAG